ncbi:uncharacterized protein LOC124136923 [Haliotis rufescens]|uniref:uncharacterized protein LOC124136923 n=1 Tax=Haliotis rufescens TaxID=6454 RepID=UPI00201F4DF2|nr:uncharacterized protein LOC124136923 [Haliotis rufescens]XP_048258479.1 uncharacterized protein LOC124136923 [Haliotis rufescens]
MSGDERTCCRWTVTLLHILTCLVAGFCILSVMIMRGLEANCLPSLTDNVGHEVHYADSVLEFFCSIVLYACGVVSGWSILSFFAHCCWENKLCFALQTVIFVIVTVLGLTGSASLTTQFLLWCKNLQTTFPNATDCQMAAKYYDKRFAEEKLNMTMYFRTEIIQQSCTWTISFLCMLLSFIYISLLCVSRASNDRTRVIYVRNSEEQPLIPLPGERDSVSYS